MIRLLLAPGACGFLVLSVQQALLEAGFDPKGTDGIYGKDTKAAVSRFQQARNVQIPSGMTGAVTDSTWAQLMNTPLPHVEQRILQLTSSFEGHGFSIAEGNWDGAWFTWGIVGFTMKYGEVQRILACVNASAPHCITDAFGDRASDLLQMLNSSLVKQEAWANSVTAGSRLVEPWRSGFYWLGQFPEVQKEQLRRAHEDYYAPAYESAARYGLKTELGIALAFDIHVQNGGIGPKARKLIAKRVADVQPRNERKLRVVIANSVSDASRERFREDVRTRKLAIATGEGNVHGHHFVMENWGLGEFECESMQVAAD